MCIKIHLSRVLFYMCNHILQCLMYMYVSPILGSWNEKEKNNLTSFITSTDCAILTDILTTIGNTVKYNLEPAPNKAKIP